NIRQSNTQAVEIESDNAVQTQNPTSFYETTTPLLELALAFLALAMELSAGLALHDARQLEDATGESLDKLSMQRRAAQERMAANLRDSLALSNEGAIFVARFGGNFYRTMLT